MKNYLYPLFLATALTTVACSDDDKVTNFIEEETPADQKEAIAFTVSDLGAVQQGAQTRAGFASQTQIVARFESKHTNTNAIRTTRSVLAADAEQTNSNDNTKFSKVNYSGDTNIRYWDDAFGRYALISVYAVAIPNKATAPANNGSQFTDLISYAGSQVSDSNTDWKTGDAATNNDISWTVTKGAVSGTTITGQTDDIIANEDLCYSNNIQDDGPTKADDDNVLGLNGRYVYDFEQNKYVPDEAGTGAETHKPGPLRIALRTSDDKTSNGRFDKGHLVFKHALTRLVVTLSEGTDDGYSSSTEVTDFQFTNNSNIKLLQFPTSGKLNIKTGTWYAYTADNITDIEQMSGSTTAAAGDYSAQMLPGYKFYGDGDNAKKNVMQFVIDDNTYFITQKMVFDALNISDNTSGTTPKITVQKDTDSKNYIEMEQGKRYHLKITVKKAKIDNITATLLAWNEVTGSTSVSNEHISLSLKTTGQTCDKDIDLYRLGDDNEGYDADKFDFSYKGKNWFGNYSTDTKFKTTLLHSALTDGKWTTPWYFESNKTYYHFRTVNKGTEIKGNTGTGADATNDYFEISAGPTATTDPHWGAPMQATSTTWLKYDTNNGYEAHLHHAIGATKDQIAIQELHMMSNIEVILQTPNDGSKVTFDDGTNKTVVKITRLATTGQVEMGRGLVTPIAPKNSSSVVDYNVASAEVTMTEPDTYFTTDGLVTGKYTYAVVPQVLNRVPDSESDDDYVGIFIQTPDQNQYYVVKKLSEIVATSVTDERDQAKDAKITRWYPGHKYIYTFTISKKGIENITCTVADWITVTGADTKIDLES